MRRLTTILLLTSFLAILSPSAKAELDPRMVALATVTAYGTIGGALLGTASMAFGTNGRAVAQGASIGLYLGLIFGSYIVLSHRFQNSPQVAPVDGGYYDDTTPYGSGGDGQENAAPPQVQPQARYWNDFKSSSNSMYGLKTKNRKMFYINFLNTTF